VREVHERGPNLIEFGDGSGSVVEPVSTCLSRGRSM